MIKNLFKMAVLKCNDMDFLKFICFTPEKMQSFLLGKFNVPTIQIRDFKPELEEIYDLFLKETMVDDCKALLIAINPLLKDGHPLLKKLKKFTNTESFEDLYEIILYKDKYFTNLKNLNRLSKTLCSFYNREITKIDIKYLKAFAASVIETME